MTVKSKKPINKKIKRSKSKSKLSRKHKSKLSRKYISRNNKFSRIGDYRQLYGVHYSDGMLLANNAFQDNSPLNRALNAA